MTPNRTAIRANNGSVWIFGDGRVQIDCHWDVVSFSFDYGKVRVDLPTDQGPFRITTDAYGQRERRTL